MSSSSEPIAIIGAGPIGLAAAAHLHARGLTALILERGPSAGHNIRAWGHVQLFSPWSMNIDDRAAELLHAGGWTAPPDDVCPTGEAFVRDYLAPLSRVTPIRDCLRLGTRVAAVSRLHHDKMKTPGREQAPFVLRVVDADGEHDLHAAAVIDTSGTFHNPAPLGCHGIAARGETALAEHIRYGLPDVLGEARSRYAGRRVMVVGGGHSAFTALRDLAELAESSPDTRVLWAIRRDSIEGMFCGAASDSLPERGRLACTISDLVDKGAIEVHCGVRIDAVEKVAGGVQVHSGQTPSKEKPVPAVDEIIAATGFRPDSALLAELRLALDPATESPVALAPLIDPNVHSCGSVGAHGAEELSHPEPGLYIAGIKSYGRAPTFLLRTGYRQVASIAAALAAESEPAVSTGAA
ncbi:NAD(P)-binding domain-containing protein [Halomonas piscis]|uniref:NAD(P)-binding domain-containing protein n=1 Tax=Halomonas piscis TaxID=3031727 RepID=A0ABY9Z1W7_9GAMM|nr:NAD(P)-binding domain-containing protein [Halomonas piscis]WNK21121.1 NAD(P)-binding domain-containing protein [Halomonas piscis]